MEPAKITIEATINADIEKVWKIWTDPEHIVKWNAASDDWHTTKAENDLKPGGKFSSRMEAKDGSFGFDFEGIYDVVEKYKQIAYTMSDGRTVDTYFTKEGNATKVVSTFDAETENPVEMQRDGWHAILNNFKKYVEAFGTFEKTKYEITINASPEKVYSTMLDQDQYKQWTEVFNPTSYYEGSWEKGSKILFLGTDKDGNTGGMVSRIKENIPNTFVSIEHYGEVHGEEEITTGARVEAWAGCHENYSFTKKNGATHVEVEIDMVPEHKSYFEETWPNALKKLKEICE